MEITNPRTEKSLLKKAVIANAVFSGASGAFLLFFARPAAEFLGLQTSMALSIIGLGLGLYALLLGWIASRTLIEKRVAWVIIELDILWVLGSGYLIFSGLLPLTTAGKWAIAAVADMVAFFALLQYLGLRKQVG